MANELPPSNAFESTPPSQRALQGVLKKILRIGGRAIPYVEWVLPLLERALGVGTEGIPVAIQELKTYLGHLESAQQQVTPALAEQQRRLDRLEHHSVALGEAIEDLAVKQERMALQVHRLFQWLRYATFTGIALLLLLVGLMVFALRHAFTP